MRIVLQRVASAHVRVGDAEVGRIGRGLLVYVGVGKEDGLEDIDYMAGKIRDIRIFDDDDGRMNRSVVEAGGELLIVSQCTLYGDCRRGRRPSFESAARPEEARPLYDELVTKLRASGLKVKTGQFQAMMAVELVNDGPVTLVVESRKS
jgi:D-tyrosyl-tRNA(Tyr) deacylase